MLESIRCNKPVLPELIILIAHISLITATPLQQWSNASQLILEKGKGCFVEKLRIIQLCEADLNFILHVIWGHHLTHHVLSHKVLNQSQYPIPGQTCHNAVLHKNLFLDLSRQTLTPGIMTDYDAASAFDWVLASLSILTCAQVGSPCLAGTFMFNLLQTMKFHLMTAFEWSHSSFSNNDDPTQVGQGVLQGSSSAVPIFILNSNVSLSTYHKLSHGASFKHPITGDTIPDKCVQFIDDTTQLLNLNNTITQCHPPHLALPDSPSPISLITHAQHNSDIWNDIMRIFKGIT